MFIKSIAATTHIDLHGTKLTKEHLEMMAEKANSSSAVAMGIEHDVTLPPIGKTIRACVEPTEDGEFQLVIFQEEFENTRNIDLPDGTVAWMQASKQDQRPFARSNQQAFEMIEVSFDLVNFESKEDVSNFLKELRQVTDFREQNLFRKSWIPDPELVFTLSKSLVAYLFGKKVIEKAGDKIIEQVVDDLSQLYSFVKTAAKGMAKYAIPKNSPITYIFNIPGDMILELVARTTDADLLVTALLEDKLKQVIKKAEELRNSFRATNIQFLLNPEGEWEFNYLLTEKGEVVGTPQSHSRRARRIQLMIQKAQEGGAQTE